MYNDTVFGGIAWSADESKVTFIGEVPDVASYKNPFEQEAKKDAEEEKKGGDEEKKEEHWQEDKFLYTNEFGESLVGKKSPGVFVFDLRENTLERVQGIPTELYPQRPIFDENGKGVVFAAV